jgi:nucleoside-triphosphatase
MASKPVKILLTGLPGCGKTTAVMRIIEKLDQSKIAGFYTQEIREADKRKGFSWTSLDGASGILAHVDIRSHLSVGKYRVDVIGFEESVVPVLDVQQSNAKLFVIDEIGKMECLSEKFVAAVRRLFSSDKLVLATVAKRGSGFVSEIKRLPDTQLLNLTPSNHDQLIEQILQTLSSLKKPV